MRRPFMAAALVVGLLTACGGEVLIDNAVDTTGPLPVSALAGTPHLPASFAVVTSRDFATIAQSVSDDAGAQGWLPLEAATGVRLVTDRAAPQSPRQVVDMPITSLSTTSAVCEARLEKAITDPYDAVYASAWLRLGGNWSSSGTGTDRQFALLVGGSPRLTFALRSGSGALVPVADAVSADGTTRSLTANGAQSVSAGPWHQVEMIVSLNTPGVANGKVTIWVDRVQVAAYSDVAFLSPTEVGATFSSFRICPSLADAPTASSGTSTAPSVQLDHVYIAGGTGVSGVLPVARVTASPDSARLAVGDSVRLVATPYSAGGDPLTDRTVTWTSLAPSVASVSATGTVRALAVGQALVVAASEAQSDTVPITVTPAPVASVSVSLGVTSLAVGGTAQAMATLRDATGNVLTGRTVTWSSSPTTVATVSSSGLVTAVAAGTATITATSEGVSGSAGLSVTTTAPATVRSVTVSPSSATVQVGQSTQLSATARDSAGNILTGRTVTWATSNSAVASVSAAGLVSGVAAGSATISATVDGVRGTASITVPTPTTTSGEPPLTVGFNNEPTGMTLLSDTDLNSLSGSWTYIPNTGSASVVTDGTSPTSSTVFQFDFQQGFAGGYAPAKLDAPSLPDASGSHNYKELYYAFYWKADTAWQNHSSNINKVAFGWTNNTSTFYLVWHWWDGSYMGVPPRSLLVNGFGSTVNDFITPNQPGLFSLQPGKWYKIEWYIKLATSSTSNDGIVRIWVNDRLMMNYTDRSRTGYISDTYFDPVWGGIGDTKQHADFYRLSHVRLSVR